MKGKMPVYIISALLLISFCMNIDGLSSAKKNLNNSISKTREIYRNKQFNDWYYKPSNYSELVSWYQNLSNQYPNYIEVFKANELYNTGNITGGYDAYYVRITNESLGLHKPEVLFLGSPHGDETVGTIGMYWFADWLMRYAFHPDYDNPYRDWLKWLIDHREIYFEICHNPYGFDHVQRYDGNGWDLNREADYDGPGSPTGGIWASINGKTLRRFIDNHTIRVGCDFHGGVRMFLYPWAETHSGVTGVSPISGYSYDHAPPDFYFYDAEALRCGEFVGNPSGDGEFNPSNIGTIYELIWYPVYGGIAPWAYGADVIKNPVEDPYVEDETFGNYPGAGILWLSPEMSYIKNPPESDFGNDTTPGFGMEVRRFILHQTDIAQPYVYLLPGTTQNNAVIMTGENVTIKWEVNGCMVVDHTYVQYGTDPDPINNSIYSTPDHDEHAGDYVGGTGWDYATDGIKNGTVYVENITINTPGSYYFVVKAQVDQIYNETLAPSEYGYNHSYLRLIKERVNESYYEEINGTDGLEIIDGHKWWYSEIIHVTILSPTISFNLSLSKGWNLITLPVENNYTASSLYADIPGCNIILSWNASIADFDLYVPGVPNDFVIENGTGYLIGVENDTFLNITGMPIESVNVPLYIGWNMLGWFNSTPTNASSLLNSILGCNIVLKWNNSKEDFDLYAPGVPNNFIIKQGDGFLVAVDEQSIWHG
ncbi:MAG TPA: hypothetical protein ENI33_09195 [Thermoplasmatales archaeon]|nr:hypothetical protein [Thermoplasmatales archaeon]